MRGGGKRITPAQVAGGDTYHVGQEFVWGENEDRQELTIGDRQGRFPGMLEDRQFHVVWVAEGHGTAVGQTPKADLTLRYSGIAVTVKRP